MSLPVLTPGQWEALIHHTSDQAKPLIMQLAAHHGHIAPRPEQCPICGKRAEPMQLELQS